MLQVCDVIFSIVGEKRLLRGQKVSYEVIEPGIQCCDSLENNNVHIKGQNTSEVKLFDVQRSRNKGNLWKGNASWASDTHSLTHDWYAFLLPPWAELATEGSASGSVGPGEKGELLWGLCPTLEKQTERRR